MLLELVGIILYHLKFYPLIERTGLFKKKTTDFTLAHRFMFYEAIHMEEVNQIKISGPESVLF